MNIFDRGFIRAKIWASNLKNDFKKDERGVSGVVAAVILVLLAVLLAAIFWDKLKIFFNSLWGQVTSESFEK